MTGVIGASTTGVVLAGGKSQRFGEADKATATFEGKTLVQRAVETLQEVFGCRPVVAVASDCQRERLRDALDEPEAVRFVTDVDNFAGPLAGLVAASRMVSTTWLFVVACDMPLLDSEAIRTVCEPRADGIDAVVPVDSDGQLEPLHALHRRSAISECYTGVSRDAGLQTALSSLDSVRRVRFSQDSTLATSTTNINTKADLTALTSVGEYSSSNKEECVE